MPSAASRPRSARGEGHLLREEVLTAACALLEEHASEGDVTLRAVARRSGVTATALYRHFENRDDLLRAAVERLWLSFEDVIRAAMRSTTDPARQLSACCEAYVAFGHQRPAVYRVLFARLEPSPVPSVGDRAATLLSAVVTMLEACGWAPADAGPASVRLWMSVHGLAELPPSHPRFPWPDTATTLAQVLDPYLHP